MDACCVRCEANSVVPGSTLCRECLDFRCTRCTIAYLHVHNSDLLDESGQLDFQRFDRFMLNHPRWVLIFD